MKRISLVTALASIALAPGAALAQPAQPPQPAQDPLKIVWGGGAVEVSAYSATYVPMVIRNLADARLVGYAWGGPSEGCVDNLSKVTASPTQLAVCQGDMVNAEANVTKFKYTVIRRDLGVECLYAVTAQPGYENWGHVLGNAWDLTVYTTGKLSGSFGSWNRLTEIYPALKDATVVNTTSDLAATEAAKADAARGKASIAFFVKRPDPDNSTFEFIAANSMTFVPVVDLDLEGKGYTFPSTLVENVGWAALAGGKPKRVSTACTQVVVVTGNPEGLRSARATDAMYKRQQATIERLQQQPAVAWKPTDPWFSKMINDMAETAPGKLKDMMDKARETAGRIGHKLAGE
jgi:hypothetical protein